MATVTFEQVTRRGERQVLDREVYHNGPGAAVLRLRPSLRGLAVALQGPAPGEVDGFRAGVQATLGAARNVACAGSSIFSRPRFTTQCLDSPL